MNLFELTETENDEKQKKDIETKQRIVESETSNFKEINWSKVIGYTLLMPPIISIFLFFYQFTVKSYGDCPLDGFKYDGGVWTGMGQGSTSTLPIYLGLMAIAGSYLIKNINQPKT